MLGGLATIAGVSPVLAKASEDALAAVTHSRLRVLAMGEPAHGLAPILERRNAWVRALVRDHGFTAVGLETGFAEARLLNAFVAGGEGSAVEAARRGFTWGFGNFPQNVALLEWLRAHNQAVSIRRRVLCFGADLSLAGPAGSWPTPAPFNQVLRILNGAAPDLAASAGKRLSGALARLPGSVPPMSMAERRDFLQAVTDLDQETRSRSRSLSRTLPPETFNDLIGLLIAGRRAAEVFSLEPAFTAGAGIPPAAWRPLEARNHGMADLVAWAETCEGDRGKVFLHAHNMHVAAAPLAGSLWNGLSRPPRSMGQWLRQVYGRRAYLIGVSHPGTMVGTLDEKLQQAEPAADLLALRTAPPWADQAQTLSTNGDAWVSLTPREAFDALMVVR